jgi:hypothetical protein
LRRADTLLPKTRSGTNGFELESKSLTTAFTVIEAKIDVGFGNHLYIRGEGGGLSWNQGERLSCFDSDTWCWVGSATESVTFKLLLNDHLWCEGSDLTACPGSHLEIVPNF